MSGRIIPDWVPPVTRPVDTSGQQPPSHSHRGGKGSKPADLVVQTLGRDQIIPILYGGPERMAGLLYCVGTPSRGSRAGSLVFAMILCEGPVESITGFEINGEPLPSNIVITSYLGAPGQGVDPNLAAAIPGFNETLPGIAYFVARCIKNDDSGMPPITALVKGLKVRDPRTTFYRVHSSIQTEWGDSAPAPLYAANAGPARDGTQTAHALTNPTPLNPAVRSFWTWAVPNDALTRTISISINKTDFSDYLTGIGLAYTGGVTPKSHVVSLNLSTGALATVSGAGGVASVVDHPLHWEVIFSMANNASGNLSFALSLYPNAT